MHPECQDLFKRIIEGAPKRAIEVASLLGFKSAVDVIRVDQSFRGIVLEV